MDNFFDILIYLIIIISIFSPLFKKKQQKPPMPERRREPDRAPAPYSEDTLKKESGEYDILKEIEGLFNKQGNSTTGQEVPEVKSRQRYIEKAEEEKKQNPKERLIKSESTRIEQEVQLSASEHKFTEWDKKITVDDEISRKAAHLRQIMDEKLRLKENEHLRQLKEKLKKPQSLKDYIIFAEILGKPKALRR